MASDIVLVEEEFEDVSSSFASNSVDIMTTEGQMARDFSGAVDVGLLGSSTDKIGSQMYSISNSIGNIQNIMRQHSSRFFTYDEYLVDKINEIEIPTDFVINNPLEINYYTQVLVGKTDGDSVNEGSSVDIIDDSFDSSVSAAQLRDFDKEDRTSLEKYDDYSNITSAERLYDISTAAVDKIAKYDDMSSISDQIALSDIDTGVSSYVAHTDDDTLVKKTNLYNVMAHDIKDAAVNNLDELYKEANYSSKDNLNKQ